MQTFLMIYIATRGWLNKSEIKRIKLGIFQNYVYNML